MSWWLRWKRGQRSRLRFACVRIPGRRIVASGLVRSERIVGVLVQEEPLL